MRNYHVVRKPNPETSLTDALEGLPDVNWAMSVCIRDAGVISSGQFLLNRRLACLAIGSAGSSQSTGQGATFLN